MPRKSTKANKTIYQLSREAAGLTREAAGGRMAFISDDKIEKIESEKTPAQPEDVMEMARAYGDPLLCNAYCSSLCPIGRKYVPKLTEKELSQITLEILEGVNYLHDAQKKLVNITVDGKITEAEERDFMEIYRHLRQLSAASNTLQLWMEKNMTPAE